MTHSRHCRPQFTISADDPKRPSGERFQPRPYHNR